MTSLCSNVFFDARCLAKAKEIQGLETLEHKYDFLEPLSVRTRVNTHHNPPTACSIEELEVIFPFHAVLKESFVTMV